MSRKASRQATQPAPDQPRRGRSVPTRHDRRWLWRLLAGALALVVAGGTTLILRNRSMRVGEITGVVTFDNVAAGHRDGAIKYEQTPPIGGPHNANWQTCGTYTRPLGNEYAVHSLEHGAVWITYRPDLATASVEQLKGLGRNRSHFLLSPSPELSSSVVASAWGVQLQVDQADDPRLARFVTKYHQGSQALEPGAVCRGGIYVPQTP